MPGRRVIVHAGFHKTGTTTAQRFLRSNGKHIWPSSALVLPGRLRKGAALMAVRYSRFETASLLDNFADDLRETLSALNVGKARKVLISDENIAGRMPGRDGQRGYTATPALLARAEDVICDIFGTEADVVFHFTTRNPDDWLRSTYKHNLRTSRLKMDPLEYAETYGASADLLSVVAAVDSAVTGTVQTSDLADLTGPEGPAEPLIDLIELPASHRHELVPHPPENRGPQDDVLDALLALNRSNLSDFALDAAKTNLMAEAQPDD